MMYLTIVGDINDVKIDKTEKSYRKKITIEYITDLIKPYNEKSCFEAKEIRRQLMNTKLV